MSMPNSLNNHTISVILPNYNYAKYFPGRLREVLSQGIVPKEIIILDDASTDNSVEVITKELKRLKKDYPTIKFIFDANKKNSGNVFSQWQKGVELATGDYIWIAELDDSAKNNFLSTLLTPLEKNQKVVLSYSHSRLIGDVRKRDLLRQKLDFFRRHHLPGKYVISGKRELNKNLAVYNSIPNVSACVFRNIPGLKRILSGAKEYQLSGDWYFYVKLAEQGKIAYTPQKLNFHRLSSQSVTSKTKFKTRYKELCRIHSEVVLDNDLSSLTLIRMEKLERKLKKKWHL